MARRTELDALRGLLLIIMALTHLPTRVSAYANQPLGFVSAAEGFVFLSALLAGISFRGRVADGGARAGSKLWQRALKLYTYHLGLLLFAFTIAAAFAAATGRPALRNLLAFYFDSPVVAIVSGPLLLYQPPLFDILPLYIVFLLATPLLLAHIASYGSRRVLAISGGIWLLAQLGGRRFLYESIFPAVGLPVPLTAAGSFDLLAWQLLWVAGLCAGARHDSVIARSTLSTPVVAVALLVCCTMLFWRHGIGGFWPDPGAYAPLLDKWHLGPLRLLNFAALAVVIVVALLPILAWLHLSVLTLLGRASLQVFCAHLLVCVASLGLIVDDDTPLSSVQETLVIGLTIAVMIFVARRSVARAEQRARPKTDTATRG
jgi:hypothetical protein